MSLTVEELKAARAQLRHEIMQEHDGNYHLTMDQVVSLMLAVEHVQGLAPRGLLDVVPFPAPTPNTSSRSE